TPYRRPSAGATFPHRCAPGDYSLDGGEIPGELSERRNRRGDLGGGGFDWRVGCVWCRREDSNLHGAINPTRSLVWRVCQFRDTADGCGILAGSGERERENERADPEQAPNDLRCEGHTS